MAETIGGVIIVLISGAIQFEEAAPLEVQLSVAGLSVGFGDVGSVPGVLPQAAVSPMTARHPTNPSLFVLRTGHMVGSAPAPDQGR
ncbi:MAG TPA: hypothetical protein VND96_15140 [Candidatus Micrarchaeaceae archaeon]|nr:hypothetical protein [Candidatus Micrarchaeaceae archaeon]